MPAERRELFLRFVEGHLRSQGVAVLEGLAFTCDCGKFQFDEALLRDRLEQQREDVQCPACDRKYPLFRAATETEELANRLRALKVETDRKRSHMVSEVKQTMSESAQPRAADTPIRLLHLTDLHLTGDRSVEQLLQPLMADLRGDLKADRLDYLVVSGDLADRCKPEGFTRAEEFLKELMRQCGLTGARLILVPGNHDVDESRRVYELEEDEKKALAVSEEHRLKQGDIYLVQNEKEYPKRFERFRNCYKGLTQQDYPEAAVDQGLIIPYPDDGIEFLTLNSAHAIDRYHRQRIFIHSDALSRALLKSKPEMKLRIVVWHHAVAGNRKVANTENIQRLTQSGYRLCLHGDVHEERNDLLNHLDPARSFHVVGAGSFSSPDPGLPYATPRQYNLLKIKRDFSQIHVRSRAQRNIDGAFAPHAIYPVDNDPDVQRGDYWITLT